MPDSESHPPTDNESSENTEQSSGRGLWHMMQRAGDDQPAQPLAEDKESDSDSETDRPQPPPNSLWKLMSRGAPVSTPTGFDRDDTEPSASDAQLVDSRGDDPSPEHSTPSSSSDGGPPLQGLWKTIGGSTTDPQEAAPVDPGSPPRHAEQQLNRQPETPKVHAGDDDPFATFEISQPKTKLTSTITSGCSRNAKLSLLAGAISLVAALLASLPAIWAKIPAPLLGCGGLTWGYVAWQDIQRSQGRQTGKALAACGMLCGVLGVFLGPLIVSPWSARMQSRFASQQRHDNLQHIGNALNAYYEAHQAFPPGGTTRRTGNGSPQPMHGWMTSLLPYLNQQAVHQSINLKLPYNHPSNMPPFQQEIDIFLIPGGDLTRVGQGYAVSHWSAVGGSVLGQMGTVPIGVMSANSRVTRTDVTDGLSQTLVAGEISDRIPAWGSATNWRRIGKGLNREYNGFGGVTGNGAMFLHADGSVRHYNGQTSPDVLKRLSTRNAADRTTQQTGG
ncbi:MAG: DUF1559 domain-containing protein [Planctomycetaceae bacterium]